MNKNSPNTNNNDMSYIRKKTLLKSSQQINDLVCNKANCKK